MKGITEETRINELLREHPETRKVLKKYGLDCFGCLGAEQESIRNAAWAHGLDLDSLLEELNGAED